MTQRLMDRVLGPLASPVRGWLKARAEQAELDALPPGERAAMLHDLGLSETDAERVIRSHPGHEGLLARRLDQVGLDPARLQTMEIGALRDMERTCSACAEAGTCRGEMGEADGVERLDRYCPNTVTIKSLLEARNARRAEGEAG